jgi:hypothetical protein
MATAKAALGGSRNFALSIYRVAERSVAANFTSISKVFVNQLDHPMTATPVGAVVATVLLEANAPYDNRTAFLASASSPTAR